MKLFIGHLLILTCLTGVCLAQQLLQSDPAMVKPGSSYTLTCKGSGFSVGSYWMHWVRQAPGKGLQWLCNTHSTTKNYADAIKGRFTISRDDSNNMISLQMNNMVTDDSSVYYCTRYASGSSYYFDIWGQGTFVTVTSAQPSGPSVFPMLPCCDSLSSVSEVTIGCLSTGYLPAPVDVTWNSGSITTGIRNLPGILSRNGNYLSTSLLTISTSDWKSNKYTCNVDHKPTGVKINKDIPECIAAEPTAPTVKVMQASCGETGLVDLVCLISGYFPDEIKIQWLLNGKLTSISPTNSIPYKDSEGKFGARSQVSVPKDDWNSGDSYTCRVSHPASSTRNEDSIHKCSESSVSQPKVVILPPSPKDLLITKEAKVTCIVEKLASTDSTEFKWRREDGKRLQVFRTEPEEGFDGTYTVKSILKINVADWYSGKQFACTVSHSDLPSPVEKTIKYKDEDVTEPKIYCFQPAPEELSSLFDFVGLTCILKQFSQKDLYVQWKKNGVVIDENNYTNTEPMLDGDGESYIMYSTAVISKSDWNRGATFTISAALKQITSTEIKKNRAYVIWENSSEDDEDSLWSTAATFITLFLLSFLYSATITIVKVKWFISRILQLDKVDEHFVTVLDSVTP